MSSIDPTILATIVSQYREAAEKGILPGVGDIPVHARGQYCPRCDDKTANHHKHPLNHSVYGGVVHCPVCEYRAGFKMYLAHALFPVRQLPDSAQPIYLREPESSSPVKEEVSEGDIPMDEFELL